MKRIVAVLFALSLAACSGGSKAEAPTSEPVEQPTAAPESQPSHGMHSMMSKMCPMHVEGTTMNMEKSEHGMVMTFTNADNAEEVQARSRMMAEHQSKMAGHHHGGEMPKFTLTAEDTDGGARLTMKPADPAQMAKMQEMMEKRHTAQGDSPCPMAMMGMMGGEPESSAETANEEHDHEHGE